MNAVGSIFPILFPSLSRTDARIPRAALARGMGSYSLRVLREALPARARVRRRRGEIPAALPVTADDEHGKSESDEGQFRAHNGPCVGSLLRRTWRCVERFVSA